MSETFVTHLECSLTGQSYAASQVHGLSEAGRPLLVRYDLARAAACKRALAEGLISREDREVLWNCATGLKYPLPTVKGRIDRNTPVDHTRFRNP